MPGFVAAGVADQHDATGLGAERAVPEGGGLGGVDGIAVAVARHRDPAPVGGGGQFGGDAQPLALQPGAAAFAGARRRGRVQHGVDRQPGGKRGVLDQQHLAVVGGVAHAVDGSSGNCCRRTEIISPASRTGDGVPLPRQSRNRTGRHTGCERNGNSTTIPTMIHRLPRPSALGSCAEPSWVQNAPNTRRPQRRNRVSSTYSDIGVSRLIPTPGLSRKVSGPFGFCVVRVGRGYGRGSAVSG